MDDGMSPNVAKNLWSTAWLSTEVNPHRVESRLGAPGADSEARNDEDGPTDGWQYFMRGVFHSDQGDPGTAATSFRRAVQLGRQEASDDSNDPRHRLDLVVYLTAAGEWDAARDETDRAIRSGAEPWHIGDALEDLQDHLVDLPGVAQDRLAALMLLLEDHRQSLEC